jgi:hypothetical protein
MRRNGLSEDGMVVRNPATAYNVYLGTKLIDTVFQSGKSDADEVRRSLINHDGYDRDIRVVKARRKNPLSEDGVVVSNPKKRKAGYIKVSNLREQAVFQKYANDPRGTKYKLLRRLADGDYYAVVVGHPLNGLRLSGDDEVFVQDKAAAGRVGLSTGAATRRVGRVSARRKNPLSEDGVVVSNPKKRKVTKKKAGSSRSGGRTEAQKNAAKAMHLWHSGKASSLAEAWEMVRAGR